MLPKGRVLIVDDNPDMGETLSDILRIKGYLPSVAHDGEQARIIVSQTNIHQAIVDIMLPDTDGVALISQIQKIRPGLRCLSMTAYPKSELKQDTLSAGASEFLTKPLDMPRLLSFLDEKAGMAVLIVDDDPSFAKSLKDILEAAGFRPYIASDWMSVKDLLDTVTPDRAIIDLNLPGKDGVQVMRSLSKRFSWLKSIVITGFSSMEPLMKQAVSEKALEGFKKPVPIEKLLAILENSFST